MSKLLILTAPSGAGKTTIARHLLATFDNLAFSISATTRSKRTYEVEGKDYYFITPEEFRQRMAQGAFLEWEEVYENQFYGTLKSELERLWAADKHIVFDVDVHGALDIKRQYSQLTLAIFIKPPSPEILFERLRQRKTESEESLQKRIARAAEELKYENNFDIVLVNDNLEDALNHATDIVRQFINS